MSTKAGADFMARAREARLDPRLAKILDDQHRPVAVALIDLVALGRVLEEVELEAIGDEARILAALEACDRRIADTFADSELELFGPEGSAGRREFAAAIAGELVAQVEAEKAARARLA